MLPNLIIIGAPKSGTSAVHYYLNLHPQIFMSKEKELNFFIAENWYKGEKWYQSNFNTDAKIRGESSPAYARYPLYAGVAERMYSHIPEAKLIYIVRDPIERIISHYTMHYALGQENRSLTEVLSNLRNNMYVEVSCYDMQLAQFLQYYTESKILVITQEELFRKRHQTLKKVFAFLGVDTSIRTIRFSRLINKTRQHRRKNRAALFLEKLPIPGLIERLPPGVRYMTLRAYYFPFTRQVEKPTIDAALRQRLVKYLSHDINSFRKFTGNAFKEWSV